MEIIYREYNGNSIWFIRKINYKDTIKNIMYISLVYKYIYIIWLIK